MHHFRLNADQLKEADRKISVFMLHVIKASESTMGGIEVVLLGVYNKRGVVFSFREKLSSLCLLMFPTLSLRGRTWLCMKDSLSGDQSWSFFAVHLGAERTTLPQELVMLMELHSSSIPGTGFYSSVYLSVYFTPITASAGRDTVSD